LWRQEQLVPLPPKPFAVLAHLVTHAGQVVTKDDLLEAVWPETSISEGVLKTCIGQVRQVLGETARAPRYIATVRGRGYRFLGPVTALLPSPPATATAPLVPAAALAPEPLVWPHGPLLGRDAALAQLQQCWHQASRGVRQVVFVTGEAGIGKTTLVEAFSAQLRGADALWLGHGQCIEQYGSGEAYLPLLAALGQLGRSPERADVVTLLRQHAPSWLAQLPALLSPAEYAALHHPSSGTTRDRMLRELAEAVEALSARRPLVLVLEDLHWSDYATLDWLAYVARRQGPARLLVLGTYRPADAVMRAHPIRAVTQELLRHRCCTELLLPYLAEAEVAAYLAHRFGTARWPSGLARLLSQRTSGNPFFLVTVVEELVRQEVFVPQAAGWGLGQDLAAVTRGVPESLVHLIDSHLVRLAPAEQEVLSVASVAGSVFSAAALAAGLDRPLEDVEAWCDRLAQRGQFLRAQGATAWPDGTVTTRYRFLHDLYHEVLYERVAASRRMRWHRQIGARLEAGYGPQVREMAAELAEHFVRGQDPQRAVLYLQQAAENAARRYAPQEVIDLLQRALGLLGTFPETPERLQHEVTLQTRLGTAFMALKGFASPEVAQVYARARELCQQLGDTPLLFPVLWGVWAFHVVHTDLHLAQPLAAQLLILAQRTHDPAHLAQAHRALGQTLFWQGEFAPACTHMEQILALADPQQHHAETLVYGQDSGVYCLSLSAEALTVLGRPDQGRQRAHEALRLARARAHPLSLAIVLIQTIRLYVMCRAWHAVPELIEALMTLATEHGFATFMAHGAIMQGWLLAAHGQRAAGIRQIRQCLVDYRQTGTQAMLSYYLGLVADIHGQDDQPDEGLRAVAEALEHVQQTDNRAYEAELYRLRGELLLARAAADAADAEACFQQALTIARRQQARWWELRAATRLARLWQHQGKRGAAHTLLAPIYSGFTEGFDTPDLQEAQALLTALT